MGMQGRKHSDETKEKMRLAALARPKWTHSQETKLLMSAQRKGRKHTDETKRKIGLSNSLVIRKPLSDATKRKISDGNRGKFVSQETRDLLRRLNTGTKKPPLSKKHKASISKAHTGKVVSMETRQLMSLARRKGLIYDPEDFNEYRRDVQRYTRYWVRQSKNPKKHLRSRTHHVDHIYSVFDGFRFNVPAKVVGHITNLRIITAEANWEKGSKSHKTKSKLLQDYRFYEKNNKP